MRFALVDNERTPPSPGLTGSCPACGSPMIAKCGNQRIHHWAHRGERVCDAWWEPEKEWHRNWKDNFPTAWQEVIQYDPSGEKHIADVHTEHGVTLEIQHSHIRPEERSAREAFYKNMVWIVDGARLSRDLPRFQDGLTSLRQTNQGGLYLTHFPGELFPKNWLDSTVPVIFDFERAVPPEMASDHAGRFLWCLLPGRAFEQAVVLKLSREVFVSWAKERPHIIPAQAILARVAETLRLQLERQKQANAAAYNRALALMLRQQRWPRTTRYRKRNPRF